MVAYSPQARFSLDALDACILDPRQRMEPFLFWEGFTYDAPSRLSLDAEDRSMFLSAVRVRKLRVGGEGLFLPLPHACSLGGHSSLQSSSSFTTLRGQGK